MTCVRMCFKSLKIIIFRYVRTSRIEANLELCTFSLEKSIQWRNINDSFFMEKASDPQMANFCEEIVQPYLEKESEHILDKDISVGQLVRNHKP